MALEVIKMKILVISLAGIGDTLMATPLISELRKNYPQAEIDVLVMWKSAAEIIKNNPNINKTYQFNMIKEGIFKTLGFLSRLKEKKYDISINTYPQSKKEYRIVAKVIGARLRISHRYDNRSFVDSLLVNKEISQDYNIQCVENNLNLLKPLNKKLKNKSHNYELFISKENKRQADKFVKDNGLKNKTLIGFHVGSGSTKNLSLRRWPLVNFLELAKNLIKTNPKIRIILFGGSEEEKENEWLKERSGNDVIIAKTDSILTSAEIIRRCKAFVSVDTALMHLAAAVKVPNQIVIETPTFNKTVEPYGQRFILIKNQKVHGKNLDYYRYDGKGIKASRKEIIKIMESIAPEEVFNKIQGALKK
jgi:heptosyltransferase-2